MLVEIRDMPGVDGMPSHRPRIWIDKMSLVVGVTAKVTLGRRRSVHEYTTESMVGHFLPDGPVAQERKSSELKDARGQAAIEARQTTASNRATSVSKKRHFRSAERLSPADVGRFYFFVDGELHGKLVFDVAVALEDHRTDIIDRQITHDVKSRIGPDAVISGSGSTAWPREKP